MPTYYKKNCDRCGVFYKGEGVMYCSRLCSDKANGDKIKGIHHPMWGKKHSKESINKMSEKSSGSNNAMFGLKGKNHPAFGKKGYWLGKKRNHKPGEWHPMLGKKHTKEHCENLSKKRMGINNPMFGVSGEKAPNWRGGLTSINAKIRNSLEYKEWRSGVFKRDNYVCVIGGKDHGNKLHADHVKSFAHYPELRFDLSNGRTLCINCHKETENYGWRSYRRQNKE